MSAEPIALVGAMDRDRYVATLFAPPYRRPHLFALYAFALEIASVRAQVSEALPGEMRLQWWRDALVGEPSGNPVADALLTTIKENKLPLQPFLDLIEARSFDLYDDLMPGWTALEGYCGETQSAIIRLATIILANGEEPSGAEAAGHAGVAYALTGLLRAFPWHARRGQVYLPESLMRTVGLGRDDVVSGTDSEALRAALAEMRARARHHLAEAKMRVKDLPQQLKPAFLPLATAESYLERMERKDYAPFATIIDMPHWLRVWRIWRQSKK
jgi:15-cis-phytoene synthase